MKYLVLCFTMLISCTTKDLSRSSNITLELHKSQQAAVSLTHDDIQVSVLQGKFINTFSNFSDPKFKTQLLELYDQDAYMNDRLQEIYGSEKIASYLLKSTEQVHSAKFIFGTPSHTGSDFYFPWIMRLEPKQKKGTFWDFQGVSRIRFSRNNKVIFHLDYWDVSELMSRFPILNQAVKLVKE